MHGDISSIIKYVQVCASMIDHDNMCKWVLSFRCECQKNLDQTRFRFRFELLRCIGLSTNFG